MTKTEQEVRQELLKFVQKYAPILAETGRVLSVDKEARTCEVESSSDATTFEVSLQAGNSGDFVCYPKTGSMVFVRNAENGQYYITMYSELDSVEFFGGELGGVPKVVELTKKINALEKELNELKGIFASWVPVSSDGGGALKSLVTTWSARQIQPTTRQELENAKIKQ